jgi:hypothetical protein
MSFNRLTDRCDSCRAQAFVRVEKNKLDLLFCAHHYNEHSTILHATGWNLSDDEREAINSKPSVSANAD